jgi:UDP-N-acetylmuramyl pentapeptide phosphotransferase/UDP-N-acetylglucosamine-1-phosphate transferase
VHVLPLVLSAAAALALAPGLRAGLLAGGHVLENYRGVQIACPLGIVIVAAGIIALGVDGALTQFGVIDPQHALAPAFVLGVAALGLIDDAYSGPSRGWRGHGGAVAAGQFPTGALKALGTLALAAWVLQTGDDLRYALAIVVLVLAVNLFNIVDLRPGRAVKLFVAVGAVLVAIEGSSLLEPLGFFAGAILVVGIYDLRERGMLGDTGSNLIGAVAGLALVQTIHSNTGLAIAAAVLLAITAYAEFRSVSEFVDRTPGLRHLDSLGRIR